MPHEPARSAAVDRPSGTAASAAVGARQAFGRRTVGLGAMSMLRRLRGCGRCRRVRRRGCLRLAGLERRCPVRRSRRGYRATTRLGGVGPGQYGTGGAEAQSTGGSGRRGLTARERGRRSTNAGPTTPRRFRPRGGRPVQDHDPARDGSHDFVPEILQQPAGAATVGENHPLQRQFQDLTTAAGHIQAAPSILELTGALLLGSHAPRPRCPDSRWPTVPRWSRRRLTAGRRPRPGCGPGRRFAGSPRGAPRARRRRRRGRCPPRDRRS